MIQRILPIYFFSLECLYLYFLLFLLYFRLGEVPSISSFLVILVVSNLVLLYSLKQKQVSGTIPLVGAIIAGGIGYAFGLTIMSVIVIMGFLFFRIGSFIKDSTLWKEERTKLAVVFYCSALIIFFFGGVFKYPHMNWVFCTVIVFTFFISVGKYLQQMDENNNRFHLSLMATTIGIAITFSVIITLLVPIVKKIFFAFFEGVAIAIGFLATPIFKLAESIILSIKPKASLEDNELLFKAEISKEKREMVDYHFAQMPVWAIGILIVIILVTIWFFVRKKRIENDHYHIQSTSLSIGQSPLLINTKRKRSFFRATEPNDQLRKLFFQFQLYSDRYGIGRKEHETMRDWFDRVGFKKNETLFIAYDHVRYGTKISQKPDIKEFEEVFRNLRQEIKDRKKKEKDKEV